MIISIDFFTQKLGFHAKIWYHSWYHPFITKYQYQYRYQTLPWCIISISIGIEFLALNGISISIGIELLATGSISIVSVSKKVVSKVSGAPKEGLFQGYTNL